MNIVIVSGSPRKESVSYRVALFLLQQLGQRSDLKVDLVDVRDYPLQPLQEVWTSVEKTPPAFKTLAETMFAANAFIIVSPEYNGSYSPTMKALFDQFPKQSRKVFGIVTSSTGAMGGMRASQQLQLLVAALFGILSPTMLITPMVDKKFDPNGQLLDEGFQKMANTFVSDLLWLSGKVNG